MQTQILLSGMRRSMVQLLQSQEQLATGLRVLRPSDNPIDTTGAMRLDDTLEAQEQYLANIDYASKAMNLADATLGSVHNLTVEAHDLALENVGATATADQRNAAATLIDSILGQLVTLGNTEYLGTFLFAGMRNDVAPFAHEDGLVRYVGDDSQVSIQVSGDINEPVNLTARQVFGTGSGVVASSEDLMTAAAGATRLTDLSGAMNEGVRNGTLVIEGSVIGRYQIDTSDCETVGDLIAKVNDALPASVSLSLEASGRSLRLVSSNGGETLQVTESGQGTIAHDLGLYQPTPGGNAIAGDDFGPRLVPQTPLSRLHQNAGIDQASGIIITNGTKSITLDFSSATTIQDVISTINTSGVGVEARISPDGTGIEIASVLAGGNLKIAENGGTTAADLGIHTFTAATALADLNGGAGVDEVDGADFRVTASDGSAFDVDIAGAATVQDAIDAINAAAGASGVAVQASLAATGNGIILTDNTGGPGTMRVARLNYSNAAEDLGILGETSGGNQIVGTDVNPTKEESLFAYLIDLREGLLANDTQAIEQAGAKLESYLDELNRYRGRLGYMARAIETRRERTEDATLSTKALLSEIKDLDYTEAITRFQQYQTALQANLTTGGQIMNTSLLDFLR
ncbi:MAG: flagellar hook-associated protein FlgL [Phycisphaerae bacterium]|nr:flagellar hook-associated protein FlgL [Phycisphaerae bacterium]